MQLPFGFQPHTLAAAIGTAVVAIKLRKRGLLLALAGAVVSGVVLSKVIEGATSNA